MELLWSAPDVADFVAIEAELAACPWLRIEPRDWEMARRIFRRLAEAESAWRVGLPTALRLV